MPSELAAAAARFRFDGESRMRDQCPNCKLPLPTDNGFIFCSGCKLPQFSGDLKSPFEILDVPRSFLLDEKELEQRYYELSKRIHPDRFSSAALTASARVKSQELSAALNQSYLALKSPEARLETLLKSIGALGEPARAQGVVPAELAEHFFELQDLVMDAVMQDLEQALDLLDTFEDELRDKTKAAIDRMFALATEMNWMQPDQAKVDEILELRRQRSYLRSMVENTQALRAKVESAPKGTGGAQL